MESNADDGSTDDKNEEGIQLQTTLNIPQVQTESRSEKSNISDVIIVDESSEKKDDSATDASGITNKQDRTAEDSDIQILEISPEKDSHSISDSNPTASLSNSVEILGTDGHSSLLVHDVSGDIKNDDSHKIFKGIKEEEKYMSQVVLTPDSSEPITFDVTAAYSTPKEIVKPAPDVNKTEEPIVHSTESLLNLPPVNKKIILRVEVSTTLHIDKETWTGELLNVTCEEFVSSSGSIADMSKSMSPSSTVSSSMNQFHLKPNRFSVASSSSSSSIASSAGTLARMLHEGKLFQTGKKDAKLSEERIKELQNKWLNSAQIYKILDYVDRAILSVDSISHERSKVKSVEEPKKMMAIDEVSTPVSVNKSRPTRGKRQAKVKFLPIELDNEIPKKRQRRVECNEVCSMNTNFSEGDSVFAKWGDRKFYAATLGELLQDGKWQVNFFDGDKKMLLEEYLIKAEDFILVGHSVYASQGDDNFTPGIITGCELKDGVLQYIVARDKGDISVPCQFIYITESQARQIRGKTSSSAPRTVKMNENVILAGNKRSTRSKTRMLLDSPKPSSSGMQVAVSATLSDSEDEGTDDMKEMNLDDVSGVEPESHGVYENGIKLKGKTLTGKMRFSRPRVNDEEKILGPIPDDGSKYFKNLHVLLTCTRPQSPKSQSQSQESSGSGTDISIAKSELSYSESFYFTKIPFMKDHLKRQLQMGGATVYEHFDALPQKQLKNAFLISNRPNTSAKYIQCVAAGVKCVSHEWVIRCCVEKKRLSLQELPVGWSLERKRFMDCTDKKSTAALKKLNLLVVETGDKVFCKFWSRICELAEINVAKLDRDSDLQQIDAVISESGYRDDVVERVALHRVPLVTTAWLIQSLIYGEPRPFDAHNSYLAEYIDSE